MNFLQYKDLIEEGDIVICYISPENLLPITICKDGINQTKFGLVLRDNQNSILKIKPYL